MTKVAISYPFVPTSVLYRGDGATVTWGRVPRDPGYIVSTGYDCHDAPGLLTLEPPTVLPSAWDPTYRARFTQVWSHDPLPGEHRIRYPWPIGWPALPTRVRARPWAERRDAVAVVTGCRGSSVPGELYSERRTIIERLLGLGVTVHLYGLPQWVWPGIYCGLVETGDKVRLLSEYRYALALENTWQPGYLTEKLPEVLAAGCAPAYLGHIGTMQSVPGIPDQYVHDLANQGWLPWAHQWDAARHREYLDKVDLAAISQYMSVEELCKQILSSI